MIAVRIDAASLAMVSDLTASFGAFLSRQYAKLIGRTGIPAKGKTWEEQSSASRTVMRQSLGDWERI